MLELKTYSYSEIAALLGTSSIQSTKKKLNTYNVSYSVSGRGTETTFTITAINDYLRMFLVFDVGLPPQIDVKKFSMVAYLILADSEHSWMPAEMMEEYFRGMTPIVSRQTISKYIRKLEDLGLINKDTTNCVYYKVFKVQGVQNHEIITKEEYCEAWKVYWQYRDEGCESGSAFSAMYNTLGGIPKKHYTIEQNGIYGDLLDELIKLLIDEVGDKF